MNDLSKKYSKSIIIIHWLTAFLMLFLFFMGKYMEDLQVTDKLNILIAHALLGYGVLFLTFARIYFYFKSARPDDLKTGVDWNDKLIKVIHKSFYAVIIVIALSGGATMIFGGYAEAIMNNTPNVILPKNDITPLKAHALFSTLFMLLFLSHVIGIVKHYLKTKENTIKRII